MFNAINLSVVIYYIIYNYLHIKIVKFLFGLCADNTINSHDMNKLLYDFTHGQHGCLLHCCN